MAKDRHRSELGNSQFLGKETPGLLLFANKPPLLLAEGAAFFKEAEKNLPLFFMQIGNGTKVAATLVGFDGDVLCRSVLGKFLADVGNQFLLLGIQGHGLRLFQVAIESLALLTKGF